MKKILNSIFLIAFIIGPIQSFSNEVKCNKGERKQFHIYTYGAYEAQYFADVFKTSEIIPAARNVMKLCVEKGGKPYSCLNYLNQEIRCVEMEKEEN